MSLFKTSYESLGASGLSYVEVPHPFGGLVLDDIRAKATNAYDALVATALNWTPAADANVGARQPYPAPRFTFEGDEGDVSEMYYSNGWTDGLPILPPTPARVEAILKGTSRAPGEVVGVVPPRNGILTVEMVATFAAMAGAKPEYMPAILAACEAVLDQRHDLRAATTTTNNNAAMYVFSGPIVKELGIQYGAGALAPSTAGMPNATIGRTLALITDVVGDSHPPVDASTLGSPGSYTMVMGENHDANPWGITLPEQMGYPRDISAVTVFEVRSYVNNNLHNPTTAVGLMLPIAKTAGYVAGLAENGYSTGDLQKELLVLGPEHALTIFEDGWSLDDVKEYLWSNSTVDRYHYAIRQASPFDDVRRAQAPAAPVDRTLWSAPWASTPRGHQANPTTAESPSNYYVIVAGGPGKHSVYMETTRYNPVLVEIKN